MPDSSLNPACWIYPELRVLESSRNTGFRNNPKLRGDGVTQIFVVSVSPGNSVSHSYAERLGDGVIRFSWLRESPDFSGCHSHPQMLGAEVTRNSGVPELHETLVCRSYLELRGARFTRNAGIPESPGISDSGVQEL